jgi:hypothetical protein
MKQIKTMLIMLAFQVNGVQATEVMLDSLGNFDKGAHKIGLNIQSGAAGGCLPSLDGLKTAFTIQLARSGFQVATLEDSHLEFAVAIEGFATSGPQYCGVKITSMVRQIPVMKILRLPPLSKSPRFRLWTVENLVTGPTNEIQALLEEQLGKDVFEFNRAWESL